MPCLDDFKLIIFDLDGVLVRTDGVHSSAYADLWERLDLEGPDYSSIAGQTTRETVEACTAHLRPSADQLAGWVDFKQQRARHYLRTRAIEFEDTVPVLSALRERGHTLALGTGASAAGTDTILGRLGIKRFFSIVVTGEDVERGKPDPEVYSKSLEMTGQRAEDTLIVEDSAAGLQAALGSGAWVVSVRNGLRSGHPRFLGALDNLHLLLTL